MPRWSEPAAPEATFRRAGSGLAGLARLAQSGYVYWYALVMLLGLFGLLTWQLWPDLSGLIRR